jgi:hypothetical protein
MIAYKVIHGETRYGTNAGFFIIEKGLNKFNKLLEKYPELKDFVPRYLPDEVVFNTEKGQGLMCFRKLNDAEFFIKNTGYCFTIQKKYEDLFKIVKVQIDEHNLLPSKRIISGCGNHLTYLIFPAEDDETVEPIFGSLFTKELRVLE